MTAGAAASGLRIDRVVTHGVFALDGGQWEVDNNIWVIGDDDEVVVVDAAHDADAIVSMRSGARTVRGR
jgi:glyoxylase-like metal-dependent hydrolase (beta-lactamase superfamily II)